MRVAAIGLAGAVILSSSAGGAEAATRGQCLPSAEMVQVLRAEGQRAVLTGQAVMVGAANLAAPLPVTYTSSADGGRGYELQTQRRSQGEVLCVTEVLSNVRLSDPAQRSFQAFRLPGGVSDQEARRIGRDEGIPNARGFNAMLEASAASGFFPVLQLTDHLAHDNSKELWLRVG